MMDEEKRKRDSESVCIRDVWAENLDEEFKAIRDIVRGYPFVAMDTEFPGVVVKLPFVEALRGAATVECIAEHSYQTLKANVDALHLIQLGLTFSDAEGNLPRCARTGKYCVWQFNFNDFDPKRDLHARDSIELLKKSGIDFDKNRERGVPSQHFAELLWSSGIVSNNNVRWIAFHSAYDFAYLFKVLTRKKMPRSRQWFIRAITIFFPCVFDVKHMIKFWGLYGGLKKVAEQLQAERIGVSHQAGSDSLLTSFVFMKLVHQHRPCLLLNNAITYPYEYAGVLYGL